MTIFRILVGAALLVSGRKLYWLFVGALGFAAASYLMTQYLQGANQWLVLGISLGVGIIGALLALWMQGFALGLAGFLGGGQIALSALAFIGLDAQIFGWLPFLVGGIIGVILVLSLFEWALIILSSLGGASLIIQAVSLPRPFVPIAFLLLAVFGIILQTQTRALQES